MNEKFFEIKKEKQDRIINGALKIFAMQGYRHASTDDIVKEAGISKGLLFHYFENKIGVYEFVYEYSVRYMSLEIKTDVHSTEDWFDLQRQLACANAKVAGGYPYMQLFMIRAKEETDEEALLAVDGKSELLDMLYEELERTTTIPTLPAKVSFSLYKKMMDFTLEGLLKEGLRKTAPEPQTILENTMQYIDMLENLTVIGETLEN